uniref:DUF169 domain-containing protein n=1 Tax=candidate division WOR-3 bacterium TaxID=2052148 RepID=A0A7C2P985_UNCW3
MSQKVSPLRIDLSVFKKLALEKPPVGVKFLYDVPEGFSRFPGKIALCEAIREAHLAKSPFYIDKGNEDCVGKMVLGWTDVLPILEAGQLGPVLGIYQEARANMRIYQHLPTFSKGTVNYVLFANLENLNFDPDLMIFYTSPNQAEIILRAMSYSTGELWEPKLMPVVVCAWLYVYPFKSGKVNFCITGLSYGLKAREVFPEGKVLISVPWNWIPTIIKSLEEMQWQLPTYNREVYLAEMKRIAEEFKLPL